MKYFKLILLAILIGIAGVAVYFYSVKNSIPDATRGWKVYRNNQHGFEFKYPNDFSLSQGADTQLSVGEFFEGSGNALATVSLAKEAYPATNFSRAFLTVSVSEDAKIEEKCRLIQREGEEKPTQMTEIQYVDSIKFYKAEISGAAAGTLAENRVYHTFHNNLCYEVSLNLFTTNIAKYDPGTVNEVDKSMVWPRLEGILGTFKFTGQE